MSPHKCPWCVNGRISVGLTVIRCPYCKGSGHKH